MGTGIALPPPEALGHHEFEMVVRKLANDLAHGADESIFVGSGLEYAQSRPYEAGDSIQSMDWKISARTGTPFVKEYDTLKRVPVQIVVDTSGSMVASSGSLSKYAMSTWIAAAIGLVAQRRMSPTRLIGGGARKLPSQTSLSRGALMLAKKPTSQMPLIGFAQLRFSAQWFSFFLISMIQKSSMLVVVFHKVMMWLLSNFKIPSKVV